MKAFRDITSNLQSRFLSYWNQSFEFLGFWDFRLDLLLNGLHLKIEKRIVFILLINCSFLPFVTLCERKATCFDHSYCEFSSLTNAIFLKIQRLLINDPPKTNLTRKMNQVSSLTNSSVVQKVSLQIQNSSRESCQNWLQQGLLIFQTKPDSKESECEV